jgi:hypothetical protein
MKQGIKITLILLAIILLTILVLITIGFSKMSKLSRLNFYFCMKNYKKINTNMEYNKSYHIKHIKRFLKIPFKPRGYYEQMNRGTTLSGYLYEYQFDYVNEFRNNKLFWGREFPKWNIPTPRIVAYKENGLVTKIDRIKANKVYFEKPIYGTLSYNAMKVKGDDVRKHLLQKDNIVVQELLSDCMKNTATTYRYVSTFEGKPFLTLRSLSLEPDSPTSTAKNRMATYSYNYIFDDNTSEENRVLKEICKKLNKLHKKSFSDLFVVGWDVMINCEQNNTLKAYCLEGNISPVCWNFPDICKQSKIDYLNKLCEKFYIKHGIVDKNYFN